MVGTPMQCPGSVTGIFVTEAAGAPIVGVDTIKAIEKRGLVGDRYFLGTGYYSDKPGRGANVTLIEREAIAAINRGHRVDFSPRMLRRNIVTAGIKLENLIGSEFRCGSAVLRGTRAFPPCAHLAYLLGKPEVLRYFAYCGGIGAEVVSSGAIRLGDVISRVENADSFTHGSA
jgi:MOSC domain-containing protein YiiM